MGQLLRLGGERASSPGCGSTARDLGQPEPQHVGLPGPLPYPRSQLGQLGGQLLPAPVRRAVPVERSATSA